MIIDRYPYITKPELTGDMRRDAEAFLTQNGMPQTAEHALAVAETAVALAGRFGLNADALYTAGLLHDISAALRRADMVDFAAERGWPVDEAERIYPFLLHQRISVEFAKALFGVEDARVLSMIKYHTTLHRNPASDEIALFLSDKLAWDQPGEPPFRAVIMDALSVSLRHAARAYIDYAFEHNMILRPHQWLLDARDSLADA